MDGLLLNDNDFFWKLDIEMHVLSHQMCKGKRGKSQKDKPLTGPAWAKATAIFQFYDTWIAKFTTWGHLIISLAKCY